MNISRLQTEYPRGGSCLVNITCTSANGTPVLAKRTTTRIFPVCAGLPLANGIKPTLRGRARSVEGEFVNRISRIWWNREGGLGWSHLPDWKKYSQEL
jgi:hypothetical protein